MPTLLTISLDLVDSKIIELLDDISFLKARMAASNPHMVLFIPRVFPDSANQQHIANVFAQQGIGWVHHVDLIDKSRGGEHYFQAFVHFVYWYNTWEAYTLQAQVNDPQVSAKIFLPDREVRPGVWRPSFWLVSECRNPLTPLERDLQSQIYDERAQTDWEIQELRDIVAQQDALLTQLLGASSSDIDEFDPLLNTPDDESELPIVGAELAASHPAEFMRDFYMECHEDALSQEWLAMSQEQKRLFLDAQLQEIQDGK